MYLPVSILHTFRVTIPTLILNAIMHQSRILTLDTARISALQTRLHSAAEVIDRACFLAHVQESSSSTSSWAGLDPSLTHFMTFWYIVYFQAVPSRRGDLTEGEQWLSSRLLLDNLLLVTWSRKEESHGGKASDSTFPPLAQWIS